MPFTDGASRTGSVTRGRGAPGGDAFALRRRLVEWIRASAGFAVRVGLGPIVTEVDCARAFQRPARGWVFGMNLIPGC